MTKAPTYLYKIIPFSDSPPIVAPLPERLPLSAFDASSGFIHLSTASQLPGTLERFFSDEAQVYVLRLDYHNIEKDIQWEDIKGEGEMGAEGIYPHLYNGDRLGCGEVEKVLTLEKGDASWDVQTLQKLDWLIY